MDHAPGCACGLCEALGVQPPLAQQLVSVADDLRQLFTDFGLRPYEVWMLLFRWTGPERGLGAPHLVWEKQVTPTPRVSPLVDLSSVPERFGNVEEGNLMLTEISGRYNEVDLYLGDNALGDNEVFYYEVRFKRHDGSETRRRFTTNSPPDYQADKFAWSLQLLRAHVVDSVEDPA